MSLSTSSSLSSQRSPLNGVIIFCHGSGDTGGGARRYVEALLTYPAHSSLERYARDLDVELVYPDATPRPYRLTGGATTSVWFDRHVGMAPHHPEDTESLSTDVRRLHGIIDRCVDELSVPSHRVCLGGFSMGGGIALQAAARYERGRLGAVFCLSSYLCDDARILSSGDGEKQRRNNPFFLDTPILMMHGDADDFVSPDWGESTRDALVRAGCRRVRPLVRISRLHHEMSSKELRQLLEFLRKTVYETDSST